MVKHLPAMWGTWVQPLGWEDPLKKEMATQYSCLEDPMKIGAWQDIVHGVSKTQIRLSTHEHPDLVTLLSGDIERVDG